MAKSSAKKKPVPKGRVETRAKSRLPVAFWAPRVVEFKYAINDQGDAQATFPNMKRELATVRANPGFDKTNRGAAQVALRLPIALGLAFDNENVAQQILRAIEQEKDSLNSPKYSKERMNMAIWPLSILTVLLGGKAIESTAAFKGKKTVRELEAVVIDYANK